MLLGFTVAIAATSNSAHAGGILVAKAATPSPSPSPSALPTATPEPPDVAIPRLQNKLKVNPNDQQAMTELASNFLAINRPDLSVQLTQRLLQMGDKTAQVYYLDGFGQSAVGNLQLAVADLEQASNLDPTNMSVLAQLADLYLRTNRPNDAERIAKRGVTFNKTEPQAYFTLGAVYAAEGHFDDAREQFEEAAKLDPKDTRPAFQIASTYAQQNNIPMALTSIDRALQLDPKNVQALEFKAQLYAAQHDDAKTAPAFDDAAVAATTDEQKVSILVNKAKYYVGEKKNSQAEGVFQQIIAQYPKVGAAHVAFADYWVSQKQIGKSQGELQAALALNKDDVSALGRLGQISMATGKYTDAIGYLKHASDLAPDPQTLSMLGQAYSYVRDYQHSKDSCAKAFQIAASPQLLACIAGADFELKNYNEASRIFDALDVRGFLVQNPDLLFIAGKTYENAHQNAKAVSAYKRLLPMMRKGTKVYNQVQASIVALSKPEKKH